MSIYQALKRSDLEYKHINLSQTSEMQNLLFNITSNNINDIRNSIIPFLKNQVSAIQFFLTLKNVVTFRPFLVNFCCQLLSTISEELKSISNRQFQRKICTMLKKQYKILLTLYELNVISADNFVDHYLFPYETNLEFLEYFYPEIYATDFLYYKKHVESEEIKAFVDEHLGESDEFKEKRTKGINEHQICQLIINDDCDGFIKYINENSVDLSSAVPFSLFESTCLVSTFSDNGMNFVEYAAFHGALKIFKYMIENKNVSVSSDILKAAIFGGNLEIIHLLENKFKIITVDFFYDAVNSHQNEIANYIIEKNKSISISSEILVGIIPSYNLEYIKKITELLVTDDYARKEDDKFLNTPLFVAVDCNFNEVVEFLVSYRKFLNINYKYTNYFSMTLLNKAALTHQIETIKILLNQKGINTGLADAKVFIFFFIHGVFFNLFFL